jgi:ubiquitin carboxyl-terminal hydrolase 20/33
MCAPPANSRHQSAASSNSNCLQCSTSSAFSMPSRCNSSPPVSQSRNASISSNHNSSAKASKRVASKASTKVPEVQIPKSPGLIGLKNLGNTCYMNAALQALSNCPEFTNPLVENVRNIYKPGLAQSFAILLHRMWIGDPSFMSRYLNPSTGRLIEPKLVHYHYLSPEDIWHEVRVVYPTFRSYFQQQDAQEFLRCFLNQIHEELKVRILDEPPSTTLTECTVPSYLLSSSSTASLPSLTQAPSMENAKTQSTAASSFQSRSDSFVGLNIVDYNIRPVITGNQSLSVPARSNCASLSSSLSVNSTNVAWPSSETLITSISANGICSNELDTESNGCSLNETGDYPLHRPKITSSCQELFSSVPTHNLNLTDSDSRLSSLRCDAESSLSNGIQKVSAKTSASKHTKYKSIVSEVFDGQLISSVQCLSCKNVSTVKETFQDLSLPIPNKEYISERRRTALASLPAHLNDRTVSESSCTTGTSELSHLTNEHYTLERPILNRRRRPGATGLTKTWQFGITILRFALLCITRVYKMAIGEMHKLLRWLLHWICGPSISLDDCLAAFFSTDELSGNNKYRCDKCKRLCNGIKYANILEAPPILCIHLKRFKHELMYTSKIHNTVSFPLHGLDLSPYIHQNAGSVVYDLVSLVCHRGNYNSGHYTTYALNHAQNLWFVYDDKIVQTVSESTVAQTQAYVLFYRKRTESIERDMNEDADAESGDDSNTSTSEQIGSISRIKSLLRRSFRNDHDPLEGLRLRRRYARPNSQDLTATVDPCNKDILDDIQL